MNILTHLSDLPRWKGAARVSVDVETKDVDLDELGPGVRRGAHIIGVSFAIDHYGTGSPVCPSWYLPIRHQGGGNYADPRQVIMYLRDQAREFRGEVVGTNLGYDLDFLMEEGVEFRDVMFRDVSVSGALLLQPELEWAFDEETGRKYPEEKIISMSLEALCEREGFPGKDEAGIRAFAESHGLHPKKDLWRMPAHIVAPYARRDVVAPLQVLQRHLRAIEEQELGRVWDLESQLLPVLVRMRRRGVPVNMARVDQIEELATKREAAAAEAVSKQSGIPFSPEDINKAAVLEKHLEADGVKCPRTPTGLPSVKAGWLAGLNTPTAKAIQECRRWNKIRNTFCASVRAHQVRGRIHCTFNQLRQERDDGSQVGVGFGRLSSSDPNLQQQPARDPEIGPLWRSIYVADEGGEWACLDYSSQEPRWITAYAARLAVDPNVAWSQETRAAALAAAEDCRTNPDWDNHSMMARFIYKDKYSHAAYVAGDKAAKVMRGNSKIIFLGRCYGMGGGKLCRSLGLPTKWEVTEWSGGRKVEIAGEAGQEILNAFDGGVPYIRGLMKATSRVAERRGWIRTAMGRRCRFPRNLEASHLNEKQPPFAWGHKALNRLIQGTSADQTKQAMVDADRAGIPLQLQVHDEIDLTVPNRAMAEQLAQIMINALPCEVPTRVDIEMGPSWGECHS